MPTDGPFKHPGIYKKTTRRRLHCRAGHGLLALWRAPHMWQMAVYAARVRSGISS
jgi:hypothetical protein